MARFNLICHGMMAHIEKGNDILIAIPDIEGHVYKYGSKLYGPTGRYDDSLLGDIPEGQFSLQIHAQPQTEPLKDLVSGCENLLLKGSDVKYAGKAQREIRIPKPSLIRCFRPIEPSRDVFNGDELNKTLVYQKPTVLHDVICFSFLGLPDNQKVTLGKIFDRVPTHGDSTLCLYSQTPERARVGVSHSTGLNKHLAVKGRDTFPTFNLSQIGMADLPGRPQARTQIDLSHLRNLLELSPERTDASGCIPLFISESDETQATKGKS